MWRGVHEIRPAGDRGGKSYDWAVQSDDEDFRVRVEGFAQVELRGGEAAQDLAVLVFACCVHAADGDVGAAEMGFSSWLVSLEKL